MHHLTFTGVDQYKYGKNRVEADAKKLQTKEDELMKRKQEIRNRLTQLKKDRKDLRTAIDNNTGEDVNGIQVWLNLSMTNLLHSKVWSNKYLH